MHSSERVNESTVCNNIRLPQFIATVTFPKAMTYDRVRGNQVGKIEF